MKKLLRLILSVATLAILAGAAYVAQENEPAAVRMAGAADRFVALLTPEQKSVACFPFDHDERVSWHFVPLQDKDRQPTRKGLRLELMNAEQKGAALDLLRASLSPGGFEKATAIMNLEPILRELEVKGAMVRHPEWYFFTIFGTPSKTGKWGFRAEGHHLSLNLTMDEGRIVAATPTVFGANPAIIQQGPRQGAKTLTEVDDLAKDLVRSLDDEQKKLAIQAKHFPEIEGRTSKPKDSAPVGLPMSRMSDDQKNQLVKLLASYSNRLPTEVAERDMRVVKAAPADKVYFAFTGELDQGKPRTYRVQGPTFLVEFINVQADSAKNPANHIHSGWRTLGGDFGLAQAK